MTADSSFVTASIFLIKVANSVNAETHAKPVSGLGQELIRQGRRVAFTTYCACP